MRYLSRWKPTDVSDEKKRYRINWSTLYYAETEDEALEVGAMVARWINRQPGVVLAGYEAKETYE